MYPETPQSLPPAGPPPGPTTEWRLYLELSSLAMFLLPTFGNILGPLILWLVKKDSSPDADAAGKQVLNFNISWTIWGFASCGLGFIAWFIIDIIAIVKAANKEPFVHPWTIRFLK